MSKHQPKTITIEIPADQMRRLNRTVKACGFTLNEVLVDMIDSGYQMTPRNLTERAHAANALRVAAKIV